MLGYSVSDTGYQMAVGLKTLFAPKIEGAISLSYVKFKTSSSTTPITFGLSYDLTDNMSIGGSFTSEKDVRTMVASVNYAF